MSKEDILYIILLQYEYVLSSIILIYVYNNNVYQTMHNTNKYLILVKIEMKVINAILSILALAAIAYLMYFVLTMENFDNGGISDDKPVNNNILKSSIMLQDTDDNKYKNLFQDNLFNTIKYTDSANGIIWSKWQRGDVSIATKNIKEFVENKLKIFSKTAKIIFCKLNRYKENINKKSELLLEYDIVFYNKIDKFADHSKILCVFNLQTKQIEIVHYNVVGKIHEDKIYMQNTEENIDKDTYMNLSGYTQQEKNILKLEDTYESAYSEDNKTIDILYSKITSEEYDNDDYIRNVRYTNNQNIVRKALLEKMLKDDSCDKGDNKDSVYKKYPYSNDFILECI